MAKKYNYQFSLSNKKVFANMKDALVTSIKEETEDVVFRKIRNKLGTKFTNGGCSAFDRFRHTYSDINKNKEHSYNRWYIRERSSALTSSFEIRNRANYAKFLYTDATSPFHSAGFRSDDPHQKVRYKGRELTRKAQLSKANWNRCLGSFKQMVTAAIKRGTNKFNRKNK